jgi:hypothetical protein
MWNGAAATLNAKPTSISASPITNIEPGPPGAVDTAAPICARLVAPVAP